MKALVCSIFLLLVLFAAKAQSDNHGQRELEIKEIGLSFQVPAGFTLMASQPMEAPNYSGKGFFLMKDKNLLAYTIGRYLKDNDKNWDKMSGTEKSHTYNIVKSSNPALTYDSLSTKMTIGKVDFNKFSVVGKRANVVEYVHTELKGFYNGYRVTIVYNVLDLPAANEIEAILLSPKYF